MKILTDEELKAIRFRFSGVEAIQRSTIEAVLEKLNAQEPMCWMTPSGEGWMMRTEPPTIGTKLGWTALYEHPLPPDDVVQKYEELLYAVHRKFPDETRHQTALRYIKTAESPSYTNASVKEK